KILFADLIITYSDYAKNKLNSLGFKNVKRVYPGIDVELYSPAAKDKEIQRLLNVTDEDFVISYPGEFSRLGATDDLVSLIINHAKEFRERKIKLCFPGRIKNSADLNKKNEIKKILQSKDMLGVVRFTDELTVKIIPSDDFMKRKYNTSDLIIFPVRSMQGKFDVPLAVIEAMACGKPVIISNLPILNEFAKENVAVRIEPGNPEILWNAIMDLYSSPEKRNQIGAEARKFVEANFDIKKIADIYQKIYAVL
ncbi:MAG: glycosyltransferase family 4 protein, partial [Candidatus Moranbacteria bacterium]|nr:glycosyltransferase family 4 protein [Candidatus Moranbacteria bacterium]